MSLNIQTQPKLLTVSSDFCLQPWQGKGCTCHMQGEYSSRICCMQQTLSEILKCLIEPECSEVESYGIAQAQV